jgi:hypothetical protein
MVRTSAPNSSAGLFVDESGGGSTIGTTIQAADMNNHQEELANAILGAGLTLSGANQSQLRQAIVALSHVVGELVMIETEETPGVYFPAIPRNVNTDVPSANYPALVTKLRAVKMKVDGVTDHSVTVAGSVITFPATTAGQNLVDVLQEDAIVSGFLNGGQPATFAADYTTAATRRCVNIAGTDYAITGINSITRAVTVSGTPASGAQTASVYTYRVAGSSTTARLHKIAGFVGVAAGEADGEVVGGFRKMDRGQGHNHENSFLKFQIGGGTVNISAGSNYPQAYPGLPISDGTNGTPRTGKTTDPRTAGQYFYTWAGIYTP